MIENLEMWEYTDFNYKNAIPNYTSIFGYTVFINNCSVFWKSKLMKCIINSIFETKYITIAETFKEV